MDFVAGKGAQTIVSSVAESKSSECVVGLGGTRVVSTFGIENLTRRRSQLSDLQQRLAKDLAKVDEELASATDSCEEKADKLNRLEQKYHDGQQARVETCQKVVKTMRSFFRQKKGEDPDEENTHQFDLVGLASLPATRLDQPVVNGTSGQGIDSGRGIEDTRPTTNGTPTNGITAADETPMEGIEYQHEDRAREKPVDAIVDVVDADGNVIGPLERVEPWNQWVESIMELEIRRPVKIRRGRRFNNTYLATVYDRTEPKGVKWLSCMIQATGQIQSKRCQYCEKNQGAFNDCVIVGGELFQKCGNCEWNRQGCHGASGDTIDVPSARRWSRSRRETRTSLRGAPAPQETESAPEKADNAAQEKRNAPETKTKTIVDTNNDSPSETRHDHQSEPVEETMSTENTRSIIDARIAQEATTILEAQDRAEAEISVAPPRYEEPQLRHQQNQAPQWSPTSRFIHSHQSPQPDTVQPSTEVDTTMKEHPVPTGSLTVREPEQIPTPQEYRVTPGFTPANARNRPPSVDRPTPTSMPIDSPQPSEEAAEEPLEEITRETLELNDDGLVYTFPMCMEGVPVAKIDEDHPYWDPHWPNVRGLIEPQLARWREKHQAILALGADTGGSSKYHIGQQVNRGVKILEFLEEGDISPYQLLAKNYIFAGKGGIGSYDTLFRLSETLSELAKFKLDIKPVEWIRQRLYELIKVQGANFNLSKTIYFYHDPKLTALRRKHGFKNVGRPSGMKLGGQNVGSPSDTPKPSKKRKSMQPVTTTPRDTPQVDQSPLAAQVSDPHESPFSTHLHKRPRRLEAVVGPIHDAFHVEDYSDTESWSGVDISPRDYRLYRVKTRLFTSSTQVTQYWCWQEEDQCFEHQVLKDINPVSWGLHEEPIDFHLNLNEISEVVWNIEALRIHVVMRIEGSVLSKKDGLPRGNVMASFKRERTMRRFLHFCREKGVKILKESAAELDRRWESMQSEQLPERERGAQ
ncbi:hypothetical protein B0T10DRAFT_586035 [Thelonectria olida]|uniref:Uncharacterized protein n=1 Tax=Thelonectria olida TaxID=1576542 RepID=A0A9P8VT57_9HYPO|nr:hypothetical protein B0T10DRAFT_586035 [Thelonectria olida]